MTPRSWYRVTLRHAGTVRIYWCSGTTLGAAAGRACRVAGFPPSAIVATDFSHTEVAT